MSDTHDHEEISIDTEAGLQQFKQHAQELHAELEDLLRSQHLHPEHVDITRQKGALFHSDLQNAIDSAVTAIGLQEATDGDHLQSLYNKLLTLNEDLNEQVAQADAKQSVASPYAAAVAPMVHRVPKYVAEALKNPRYKEIATEYYSSPAQLTFALEREIARVEVPSKFDSVFGVEYSSAFFTLFRDALLDDLIEFDNLPIQEIREHLREMNIDYYIYTQWIKALPGMVDLVRPSRNITFGELFVQAEMEVLVLESDN